MDQQAELFWLMVIGALAAVGQFVYAALAYHRGVAMQPTGKRGRTIPQFPYGRMLFLVLLCWGAVGFYYYDRHKMPGWGESQFTVVQGKTFKGETVPLDGYAYVDCTFENVTFEYNGTAPSSFSGEIRVQETSKRIVKIESKNPVVRQTLDIARALFTIGNERLSIKRE